MTFSPSSSLLVIDVEAIAHNYRLLASCALNAVCGAVVKANAYGLGMAKVAPVLAAAGCTHFFVAHLEEAITLRSILPYATIYVFHGVQADETSTFLAYNLIPVLNSPDQITTWKCAAAKYEKQLPALLHVDTGMQRLGLSEKEFVRWSEDALCQQGLSLQYVMSHLAAAEIPEHPLNAQQLNRLNNVLRILPLPMSLCNSSGIFLGPEFHGQLLRPGCALYGINPTPYQQNPMQQAVSLYAPILQLRNVDVSEPVGYGAAYVAPRASRIAVVPFGYADGYLRTLSNNGFGWIAGVKVPVVGRVSMDLITLDVTSVPDHALFPGALIEMMGEHCPVDEVAFQANTIGYELFTRLGSRFKRHYDSNEAFKRQYLK